MGNRRPNRALLQDEPEIMFFCMLNNIFAVLLFIFLFYCLQIPGLSGPLLFATYIVKLAIGCIQMSWIAIFFNKEACLSLSW